jgi:hypothetical protein
MSQGATLLEKHLDHFNYDLNEACNCYDQLHQEIKTHDVSVS